MMRVVLCLVVVLGASAGAIADPLEAPPPPGFVGDGPVAPAAPLAALIRGDAAAFARQVAAPLAIQDLWFDTKPCRAFSGRQEVEAARLPALARCLSDLGVRARDQISLFYGPGILVEGELADDGRLTSLVGPVPLVEGQPLVEASVLAEHVAGLTPVLTPDAVLERAIDARPGVRVVALVNVCFDARGRVSRADASAPGAPSYRAQALAVARRWRARPFRVHGAATPVCARLLFVYPTSHPQWLSLPVPPPPAVLGIVGGESSPPPAPPSPAGARIVAPTALEGHRTAGTVQIQPDDATKLDMQARHVSQLVGTWKLCVDTTGKVSEVVRLRPTGAARYDAKIEAELAKWRYSPYQVDGKAVPVCTAVTFIYRQR